MTAEEERLAALLHLRAEGLGKGEAVSLPIHATTTFNLPGAPEDHHFYARAGNPTVEALEVALGHLEQADVVAFPSGMAAIAAIFFSLLKTGDTVLLPADGYYNTRKITETFLTPLGVTARYAPTAQMDTADMSGCALVFIETPSNPGLDVCDVSAVAARAHAAGARLIADNTSATCLLQQPLDHGCAAVISAGTKALAGHSDVLAGHVASRDTALIERIRTWRTQAGATVSPFDAFLVHRGLMTAELRLSRMCKNAFEIARHLSAHPAVEALRYPGLAGDPSFETARAQMSAGGTIVSFELSSSEVADAFIAACPLLTPATSFGGVHSAAERRARWGDDVPAGFVRLSAGIEPTDALISSLLAALDQVTI